MKFLKKILFALLILFLSVQTFNFKAFAENNSHLSITLSTDSLNTGETLKANIQCESMCVASFLGSIFYDNELLELVDKSSNGFESENGKYVNVSVENNKESGVVALILIGTTEKKYEENSNVLELTFKAKKQGTAQFYISESSDGPDGCNADKIVSVSVTVDGEEIIDENSNTKDSKSGEDSNKDKKIKEINIVTPPTKTKYNPGESFDPQGMVVEVVYEDDTVERVFDYEMDKIIVDENNDQITISYGDLSATQKITVIENNENNKTTSIIAIVIILVVIIALVILLIFILRRCYGYTSK